MKVLVPLLLLLMFVANGFFDRLDTDKSGFVTEVELNALWRTKP